MKKDLLKEKDINPGDLVRLLLPIKPTLENIDYLNAEKAGGLGNTFPFPATNSIAVFIKEKYDRRTHITDQVAIVLFDSELFITWAYNLEKIKILT
jgi:hypothetical protein